MNWIRKLFGKPSPVAPKETENIVPLVRGSSGSLHRLSQPIELSASIGASVTLPDGQILQMSPAQTPLIASWVSDLTIGYAIDQPNSLQYLTPAKCESLGIELKEVHGLALSNLKKVLPPIQRHGETSIFMLSAGGNFEASLLLLDDLWEAQEELVSGRLVVAVPARDMILFASDQSEDGLRQLRESISSIWQGGNQLVSQHLLVREANRWQMFEPLN
jgi:Protein of unknown function (DUF1444)